MTKRSRESFYYITTTIVQIGFVIGAIWLFNSDDRRFTLFAMLALVSFLADIANQLRELKWKVVMGEGPRD